MRTEDLEFFRAWFRDYVRPFYSDDEYVRCNIRLKEDHTWRVCEIMKWLGREMKLDDNSLLLAETAALFHDIGRFDQFRRYRTFNDRDSENHAALAVKVLEQQKILDRLLSESNGPTEKRNIICSIRYHNVYQLPQDISCDCQFFTRLLRDADKLDIWQVVIDYYDRRHKAPNPAMELDLQDIPECSPFLIEDLMQGRCSDGNGVKTYNDLKLMQLSWIYDINFTPSFRFIRDRGYVDRILAHLPEDEKIKKAGTRVHDFIRKKLNSQSGTNLSFP